MSLLGSELAGFAVAIWVLRETESIGAFGAIMLVSFLPSAVAPLIAGALVDRYDRRKIMLCADVGAALITMALVLVLTWAHLQVWHILVARALSATLGAFHGLAFLSATAQLVPERHLGRAAGAVQLSTGLSQVVAPGLAGAVLFAWGLHAALLIDVITFGAAFLTLWLVRFPASSVVEDREEAPLPRHRQILSDIAAGWRFIRARPGLLGLLPLIGVANFQYGMTIVLLPPMVLAFANEAELGTALSVAGLGTIAGGLLMGTWGGPRRRITGILWAMGLSSIPVAAIGWRPSLTLVTVCAFLFFSSVPIAMGCNLALWQAKVPERLQGRALAIRRIVGLSAAMVAFLVAGPLAEATEDVMASPGPLRELGSALLGGEEVRGIGMLFLFLGASQLVATLWAAWHRPIRCADELPAGGSLEPDDIRAC